MSSNRRCGVVEVGAQTGDELVTPVADDRVERPEVRAHHHHHADQRMVAGCMPGTIVDPFQVVDIDERDHEASVTPPGAVHLLRHRDTTFVPPIRAGEIVPLRDQQRSLETRDLPRSNALARRHLPLAPRELALARLHLALARG